MQHSDRDLYQHYQVYGRAEGRIASQAIPREKFISFIANYESALEIGPFNRPMLSGPRVKYFDILTSEELRSRAIEIGESPKGVPNIDFVSKSADLRDVSGAFDVVASSHCIEHQPNLVKHLCDVERLLGSGGCYCLIIPDCRFCFDHFISLTTIADILEAHFENRQRHKLGKIIEHRVLTCHNDAARHWANDSGEQKVSAQAIHAAIQEWENARGGYVDVHAWQFTPPSFRKIISLLNELGLVGLKAARVYDTPYATGEFFAVLHKTAR
jgi:SAM-dependent methyltransferase